MRIDILISTLPKGINDLEMAIEEQNIKNAIGKMLSDMGYTKFIVAGSDMLQDDVKGKVVLD